VVNDVPFIVMFKLFVVLRSVWVVSVKCRSRDASARCV